MKNLSNSFHTVFNGEYNSHGICECGGYFLQTKRMFVKPPIKKWINGKQIQQEFSFMGYNMSKIKDCEFINNDIWRDYNGAEYKCEKCGNKIIILEDYSIVSDLNKYERNVDIYEKEVLNNTHIYE